MLLWIALSISHQRFRLVAIDSAIYILSDIDSVRLSPEEGGISMSRKKLLPPRDPVARQLYSKRQGRTLPQLRHALAVLGCSVAVITVKQWLRGRHRPGKFTRPLLSKALKKL